MRETAGTAAAPAARCRKFRRGSFMAFPLTCGGDLVHFRAGEFDHLGPLLSLAGEKLGEIGGRARQRRATQLGNPRLHSGVGKGGVEFLIEPLNNGGGCAGGRSDAVPRAKPHSLAGNPPRSEAPAWPPSAS